MAGMRKGTQQAPSGAAHCPRVYPVMPTSDDQMSPEITRIRNPGISRAFPEHRHDSTEPIKHKQVHEEICRQNKFSSYPVRIT